MRDLALLFAMFVFVPIAFNLSFAGLLLWGWSGLVALNSYMFGFMSAIPFVQLFAIVTMASVVLKRDPQMVPFEPNRTLVLFWLFVAHGLICAILAYPGLERNWELFGNVAKTVLFCSFMPMLVTSRLRVHALIVMIVIATCFHGALDGLKFVASGGGHNAQTIPKFGDNNHLAMVLLMVLPLAYYLIQNSKSSMARLGFSAAILLTVLAVVATHSRGGLIGLFAVAFWIVMQGRRKMLGLVLVLLCAFLVLKMAPESWSERMGTIQEADKDQSFMERVTAWKVSSAIALAHPVFGGGFRAVQSHPVWDKYAHSQGILGFVESPVIERSGVAAHSMWFEVMGDLGFVGFFLFVALLVNAFLTRRAIRRLVKEQGARARWAGDLADMLGASLFVYMVTGSSLSVAYFELPYICMMVMEVVRLQLVRQARSALSVTAGQG